MSPDSWRQADEFVTVYETPRPITWRYDREIERVNGLRKDIGAALNKWHLAGCACFFCEHMR